MVHCVHPTEQPVIRRVHEMHHKHIHEQRTLTLVDRDWQGEFWGFNLTQSRGEEKESQRKIDSRVPCSRLREHVELFTAEYAEDAEEITALCGWGSILFWKHNRC